MSLFIEGSRDGAAGGYITRIVRYRDVPDTSPSLASKLSLQHPDPSTLS
jgi:hypothetical protein